MNLKILLFHDVIQFQCRAGCARRRIVLYQLMTGTARPTGSMFVTIGNLDNKFHSRMLNLKPRHSYSAIHFAFKAANSPFSCIWCTQRFNQLR